MNSLLCSTHPNTQQRMANLQRNIACLQFSGRPCARHVTYALADRLGTMRTGLAHVEQYEEETTAIAEGRRTFEASPLQTVEIKPNPKDATVLVDGSSVAASLVSLSVGPHVVSATREGYRPAHVSFGVFPDIARATIELHLEKCKNGTPCN
jgi:hypothetical protein